MVSLITSSNHFVAARYLIPPVVSSLGLGTNFKCKPRSALVFLKKECSFGFAELRRSRKTGTRSGFLCKGLSESEADLDLEREILEFMKNSRNPDDFPTKKELLDAGRVDLVNAIVKKGGWLSLGWDSDDEDEDEHGLENDFDVRDLQTRLAISRQSNEHHPLSISHSSSESASSSGRSLEMAADQDTGIEGILSRLERDRSLSFGIDVEKKGSRSHTSTKDDDGRTYFGTSVDMDDEIYKGEKGKKPDGSMDKILSTWEYTELLERSNDINPNQIKSRLQHLQLELSSALHSLRAKSGTLDLEVHESKPRDLEQLSDVWEFKENEFMNAQDKLRSIRAKLAVLEGKMALSIINAQKMIEEKQRRIDNAHRTIQLLRTTCIVWPNSASEVSLAGSFDGWTTQRKMEKSSTGIFSVSLKLYPGRYEIKFIVDGVWKVDPLRPIVGNNGYENNILIIT